MRSIRVKFLNSVVTLGSNPNEFMVTVTSRRENCFWFYLIWIWPQMTKSTTKIFKNLIFFRWRTNQLIVIESSRNQLAFKIFEHWNFKKIIDLVHYISKYLFWMNCLKDNYGFLEFTISDLSNADTVCVLGQLVPCIFM